METATTLQVIDALDLTNGSHDTFSLDGDLILGQRSAVSADSFAQGLDANVLSAPSIAAAGTKKPLVLMGTDNADTLVGGKGSDKIYGQGGDDILIGGKGNDLIVGGGHSGSYDQMTGGKGKDTFSLVTSSNKPGYINDDQLDSPANPRGFALINDFKVGQDKIQLSGEAAHYQLVVCQGLIDGYRCLSLMRASRVVNRQSTLVPT